MISLQGQLLDVPAHARPAKLWYGSYQCRKIQAAFLRECARRRRPCAWCHEAIDYRLSDFQNRLAPTVDHIVERWQGGSHSDPRNFQPMHKGCNSVKSHARRMAARSSGALQSPQPMYVVRSQVRASRRW